MAAALLFFTTPALAADNPLPVVEKVDLARYVGKWYEIASLPKWFQKGCTNTTATYALRKDGDVGVTNRCLKEDEVSEVTGKAWVVDKATNAKLKVQFFWPFSGDYWIIALDADYRYVMVGTPDRESLWILSRTPALDEEIVTKLLDQAKALGFAVDKVKRTEQALTKGQDNH